MPLLRPLDPAFPIERQIAIDAGPVVLVNPFTLGKEDEETFLTSSTPYKLGCCGAICRARRRQRRAPGLHA